MTQYHVAKSGSDVQIGSADQPFLTINRAAQVAQAGDEVVVHAGVYREWVKPANTGLSDQRRITFIAAPGEAVAIKGSERITGWVHQYDAVWRVSLPNVMFGDFNPYVRTVEGDWLVQETSNEPLKHLGEVYLDGKSFYEALDLAELTDPPRRTEVTDHWTGVPQMVADPEQTQRLWYSQVDDEQTTIWANFGSADPNTELVEINVRRSVFYPIVTGRDYITVQGFELAQAACPWTPPTADQPGLIGPNWAKGWVIADNVIHDAKCSAISIGKEASTGDNYFSRRRDKPGYQYQLEAVFAARAIGWSKELIGSHVIRGNTIYDCGQNAIVGHLGCVFSTISDNHIYNIALKREFFGHEIAGIKLHAAIDVEIRHNLIHDCSLGIWLDWQAQGTRVWRNVLCSNSRDLFVEVSHGPYLVDHNVLASPAAIELFSQGGAFVGNLIGGTLYKADVMDRATPYHRPHSTEVAGYAVVYGADDRWVGNIFAGPGGRAGPGRQAYGSSARWAGRAAYGTAVYDGHPDSFAAYLASVEAALPGDLEAVIGLKQAAYLRRNLYLGGAVAYQRENGAVVSQVGAALAVKLSGDQAELVIDLPPEFASLAVPLETSATLEPVRLVGAAFEAPDGGPVVLDTDLLGQQAAGQTNAGPVFGLRPGANSVQLW